MSRRPSRRRWCRLMHHRPGRWGRRRCGRYWRSVHLAWGFELGQQRRRLRHIRWPSQRRGSPVTLAVHQSRVVVSRCNTPTTLAVRYSRYSRGATLPRPSRCSTPATLAVRHSQNTCDATLPQHSRCNTPAALAVRHSRDAATAKCNLFCAASTHLRKAAPVCRLKPVPLHHELEHQQSHGLQLRCLVGQVWSRVKGWRARVLGSGVRKWEGGHLVGRMVNRVVRVETSAGTQARDTGCGGEKWRAEGREEDFVECVPTKQGGGDGTSSRRGEVSEARTQGAVSEELFQSSMREPWDASRMDMRGRRAAGGKPARGGEQMWGARSVE
eukprot:349906-Chlamydomonas_euryale.AAC.10